MGSQLFRLLALIVVAVAPVHGHERLVRSETDGASLICLYRSLLSGTQDADRAVRVGLGEPCPAIAGVEATANRQSRPGVPLLATLVKRDEAGLRPACIYQYEGRLYRIPSEVGRSCPVTPGSY